MIAENLLPTIASIESMGFKKPEDILFYLPIKYHDYTESVSRMRDGLGREDSVFFRARVKLPPKVTYPNQQNKVGKVVVTVTDGYEDAVICVFGALWDWKDLTAGQDIHVVGKVTTWEQTISIKSAKLIPTQRLNKVYSQYKVKSTGKGKKKVEFDSDKISQIIAITFNSLVGSATLTLCNFIGASETEVLQTIKEPQLASMYELFRMIHFPKNMDEVDLVSRCIKKMHGIKILKDVATTQTTYTTDSVIDIKPVLIKELLKSVPFSLTNEQKKAVWDAMQQLSKPLVAQHLVSGDVGCGKTIVYSLLAVAAYKLGKQVTILIPNLPLADQVFSEIKETWPEVGVALIKEGSTHQYESNDKKIVVGTTAILGWSKKAKGFSTDLLIVDEQQKMGANQKNTLLKNHTNIIEATATALPRTTMLALTGAYTISKIEKPPVKKDISSVILYKEDRKKLFDQIHETIAEGNQVAILYPLKAESSSITLHINTIGILQFKIKFANSYRKYIKKVVISTEESQQTISAKKYFDEDGKYLSFPIQSIEYDREILDQVDISKLFHDNGIPNAIEDRITDVARAQQMWETHFPDNTVMLHGGLTDEEKLGAVAKAKNDEVKLIISSSMIEIGLTFPKLTTMIVVDPQNMGVSTLHQLRGRLVRHGGVGSFLMFVNKEEENVPEEYVQRLKLLERFERGSQLAEHDMLLRGFGELGVDGLSQSGHKQSIFVGAKILPEDLLAIKEVS